MASKPDYRAVYLQGISQPLLVSANWSDADIDRYLQTDDARQRVGQMQSNQGVGSMLAGAGYSGLSQLAALGLPYDREAARDLMQSFQQRAENAYSGPTSLADTARAYEEGGIGTGLGALGKTLGYNAAVPLTPVVAGSVLGGPGAGVAAGVISQAPLMLGQNLAEQDVAHPDQPLDPQAALLTTGGQLASEALADRLMLGLPVSKTIAELATLPKGSTLSRMGGALARTGGVAGVAGLTNAAQQAATRAQANEPLLSPEALSQYGEAGGIGALLGGTVHGIADPLNRRAVNQEVDAYRANEAARMVQDKQEQQSAAQAEAARIAPWEAAQPGQTLDLFGAPASIPQPTVVPSPTDMAAQLSAYAEQQRQNYVAQGLEPKAASKLAKADAKDQARLLKQQVDTGPAPVQGELPFTPPAVPEAPQPFQINPEQFPRAAQQQRIQQLAGANAARIQAQTPDATSQALVQGLSPDVRAQLATDTQQATRDLFGAPVTQEFRNGNQIEQNGFQTAPANPADETVGSERGSLGEEAQQTNAAQGQEVAPQQRTLPFPVTEQPDLFGGLENGQTGQVDRTGQAPGAEGLRGNAAEGTADTGGAPRPSDAQIQVGPESRDGLTEPAVVPLRGGQTARPGTGVRDQLEQLAQRNRADVTQGRTFNEDNVMAKKATPKTLDNLAKKVESRMADGTDMPTALERLATDVASGKERLSDVEHALARSAYQRSTGRNLDRAIEPTATPEQQALFSNTVRTAKQTVDDSFMRRLEAVEDAEDHAIKREVDAHLEHNAAQDLEKRFVPWLRELSTVYDKAKAVHDSGVWFPTDQDVGYNLRRIEEGLQRAQEAPDARTAKAHADRLLNDGDAIVRELKQYLQDAQNYRGGLNTRSKANRENARLLDAALNNVLKLAQQRRSPDVNRAKRIKESDIPFRGENAAAWMGRTASEPWMRELAQKLRPYLRKTQVQVVEPTDRIPEQVADAFHYDGASGVTLTHSNGDSDIYIRRSGSAMQEDILLHELMHGATEEAFAQLSRNHPLYQELDKARLHFLDALQDSSHLPFFKQVLTDPAEFLAYGLSSPTFRELAQVIPAYKGAPPRYTLWQRFVNWVRQLLGGTPKRIDQLLMGDGRVYHEGANPSLYRQIDSLLEQVLAEHDHPHGDMPGSLRIARATQAVPARERVEQAKQVARDTVAELPRVLDRVTNKYLDKGASVEKKLQASMNGAIRNGNLIRADLYMRQADDASQLARVVTETGKLTFNEDGFAQVVPDAQNIQAAAQTLAAGAQRLGISKEEARNRFTQYGIAYRMQDIANQTDKLMQQLQQPGLKPGQVKAIQETIDRLGRVITLSPEQIQAQLALAKSMPELEQTRQTVRQAFRNATDAAFKAGALTPEQYAQYQSTDGYIPFKRLLADEQTEPEVGPKKYFRGLTSLPDLKKIKGSDLEINDLMGNALMGIDEMTQRAVRNNAAQKLGDGMIDIGEGEIIPDAQVTRENSDRVVTYLQKGKPRNVLLNDALDADAFRPTQNVTFPGLRTLRAMSQFLRASVVLQPDFALRQLVMDSANAGLMSGTQSPFKMTADVLKEGLKLISTEVRGKPTTDPWVLKLRSLGTTGRYDSVHVADPDVLRALQDAPTTAWGLVARGGQKMVHFAEKLASSAEFAQRVAIAKRAELETGDPVEAWYRAHEIINYSRRGSSPTANALLQTVPFMGAWASATNLFLKTLGGRGLSNTDRVTAMRQLAGTVAKMAMASTLYAWMTEDNQQIQDRPVAERYKTFYVPVGEDTLLAVPVRPEAAMLFKWIPERLWQLTKNNGLNDNGRLAWRDTKNAALDALLFGAPVPAGVKPLVENYFNRSFFTGRPIVSDYLQQMPKDQQFGATTSELAKVIGDATGQSPMMIDNLLRGYTGPLMNYANAVSFHLANQFSDKPLPAKRFVEEPLIRSFFKDTSNGSQNLNDFYDMLAQTEGVAKAYKRALEEGRTEDAVSLYSDRQVDIVNQKALNQINNQLHGINAAIRNITGSTMDSDSKRMQLDALRGMQKTLAANARQMRVQLEK